jgi:hypothetical protein
MYGADELKGKESEKTILDPRINILAMKELAKKMLPKLLMEYLLSIKSIVDYMPVNNYYKTKYNKHVLISYVVNPFRRGVNIHHTNSIESLIIARAFYNEGYNVDVVWLFSETKINYEKYDVIFGLGEPFERSFYNVSRRLKRICYVTGMHPYINNQLSIDRIKDVYSKRDKLLLKSSRLMDKCWTAQFSLSDGIIALGNNAVMETFAPFFSNKIVSLPPSYHKIYDFTNIIKDKDFSIARNNFLWFGGSGFVHKGVDLLLEYFTDRSDINLHICGPISEEPEFATCYHKELYNTPNIKTYGFISLNSQIFRELLKKCAFVIFPSCAEGGGASVINVMANGGLIPIVTKASSIEISEYGIQIESTHLDCIHNAIEEARMLTANDLSIRSYSCGKYVSQTHSVENFTALLESAIKQFLKI